DPEEKHVVAVLEVAGKPGTWRAWVDNRPASPPVSLPQSHGKFRPQALGESWNDGAVTCNVYDYGFGNIQIVDANRGGWKAASLFGYAWNDKQNQTIKQSSNAFEARGLAATSASEVNVPPLLGWFASKATGRSFTAECVKQDVPLREESRGHLLVSLATCR